ncbi:MAG TPA: DUF2946 family protein [Burkholderiaceae bacterium]|nr:DUF2946 family protein [Burkholderiaceae bacterium]
MSRRLRPFIAQLACLALLWSLGLAAWGPWLMRGDVGPGADVCGSGIAHAMSSAGPDRAEVPGDSAPASAGHTGGLCDLCCSAAAAAALPPAPDVPASNVVEAQLWPVLLLRAGHTLAAWAPAQARAPPAAA